MKPLPLLREHPRSIQFVLAIAVPTLFGGLTGYLLGVSEPVYLIFSVVGIVGAVGAGFDHLGARAGAGRGIVAGSIFGASILIAHEIHGAHATAHLPEPAILLVVVTTVLGCAFAALGGRLRKRVERREEPAAPQALAASTATQALAGSDGAPAPVAVSADGHVSLNSGSFEDYRSLGMSVTQAKRLITYRDHLGGYSSVEDLDKVPGFPKAFLADLKRELAT